VLPVELTRLPLLEKIYPDNNKLSVLAPEVGALRNMKVLSVDNNMLVSVPGWCAPAIKLALTLVLPLVLTFQEFHCSRLYCTCNYLTILFF
jgi:Leucine-rich repeat (LRR) protein